MNIDRLTAYSLGVTQGTKGASQSEVESKKDDNKQSAQYKQKDPQAILNSLDLLGKQNMVNMTQAIKPEDYLSPERIAEIQASMGVFEYGVEAQAELLEQEFGHLGPYASMSEADKMAIAAQSWVASNE